MSLLDKLKAKVKDVAGNLLTDGVDVEEKLPDLVALTEDLDDIFGDGLQWDDVSAIFVRVVPRVMQIAESFGGRTGKQKKEFVIDSVYVLYKHYDPNIPRIPDFIENPLEAWLVPLLTELVIDTVHPFLFHKPDEDEDEDANETKVLPRSEDLAE